MKIAARFKKELGCFLRKMRMTLSWRDAEAVGNKPKNLAGALAQAQHEWKYAKLYFNCVTDPDLIDHAIFNLGASEKKYIYLLKQARETGLNTENFRIGD